MILKNTIRDLDTGLFFCCGGQWTADGRLSLDFPDARSAMEAVERYHTKNAEFVAVDENGRVTAGMPLRIRRDGRAPA